MDSAGHAASSIQIKDAEASRPRSDKTQVDAQELQPASWVRAVINEVRQEI